MCQLLNKNFQLSLACFCCPSPIATKLGSFLPVPVHVFVQRLLALQKAQNSLQIDQRHSMARWPKRLMLKNLLQPSCAFKAVRFGHFFRLAGCWGLIGCIVLCLVPHIRHCIGLPYQKLKLPMAFSPWQGGDPRRRNRDYRGAQVARVRAEYDTWVLRDSVYRILFIISWLYLCLRTGRNLVVSFSSSKALPK